MPPPVSGYAAWYDATQISGADGSTVTAWDDLSVSGYNLTPTGTPILRKSQPYVINEAPVVDFGAGGNYFTSSPVGGWGVVFTGFFVVKPTSAISANYVVWGASSNFMQVAITSSVPEWTMYQGSATINGGTPANGSPAMLTTFFDGASSALRVNGTQVGTGNPGSNSLTAWQVGNVNSGASGGQWHGVMGEIILYDTNLTGAQITSVEAYLKAKWFTGLTLGGWRQNMPFKRTLLERLWTPPRRELWRPALLPC